MPSLIILRGLPGSGKSTLAKILNNDQKCPAFSVDDYFTDAATGVYEFRFAENHMAYLLCQNNTEKAMQQTQEKIFLHNTFTLAWEIEPYFKLAAQYNYRVFVLTVENYHGGKSIHGISDEQMQKMAEKYNVKLF
jgi:predicted kinase